MNKQFYYFFRHIRLMLSLVLMLGVSFFSSLAHADDVEQMKLEREQFIKEIRRVENLNKKYTSEIEDMRSLLNKKEVDFNSRMNSLEGQLQQSQKMKEQEPQAQQPVHTITPDLEEKTGDILSRGGDIDPEDEKYRDELAKAHYNMGNIFYERGEYQRAVVEYYQAVDLMPYDPDTHYNLAFVSSEYLGDQETALKHYQWYLYLKPDAGDAKLVKEKILAAKFHLRSTIDSSIDKDNGQFNIIR